MKSRKMLAILVLAMGLMVCPVEVSEAAPMGTAFTYQGRLMDANSPADGLYDFQFKLYDSNDPCTGAQLGSPIDINDLDVIDGYFTVELDFGSDVFNGDARWLETTVSHADGSDPCTLRPRIEITPVPYALQTRGMFVDNAGNVGIGTRNPGQTLDVRGGILAAQGLPTCQPSQVGYSFMGDGCYDTGIFSTADGDLRLLANSLLVLSVQPNGNVGIGTSSPARPLHIQDGQGSIRIDRDENSPSVYMVRTAPGDFSTVWKNFGIGTNADGQGIGSFFIADLGTATGGAGTERIHIDNEGNVGIGTDNPESALHVEGTIRGRGEHMACNGDCPVPPGVGVYGESDTSPGVMGVSVSGAGVYGYSQQGYAGLFYGNVLANGDVRVSGNVGIGTDNPESALHVEGTIRGRGEHMACNGDCPVPPGVGVYGESDTSPGVMGVSVSGAGLYGYSQQGYAGLFYGNVLANGDIYTSANVGIGTTNPSKRLEVDQGDVLVKGDDGFDAPGEQAIFYMGDTNHSIRSERGFGLKLGSFGAQDAIVVREATGNVGIGTPIPSEKLEVAGAILSTGIGAVPSIRLNNTAADEWRITSYDTNKLLFWNGSDRMAIDQTGNVGIGTTSPASRLHVAGGCITGSMCSDIRLKKNIEPLLSDDSILDRVMGLQAVTFEWKHRDDGKRQIGLIAQDVEEIFPEVVTTPDDDSCEKGLLATGMDAVLVEAIKELKAKNELLRQRLEALEKTIHQLAKGKEFEI